MIIYVVCALPKQIPNTHIQMYSMSTYNRPSSNDVIIKCVEYSPEIKLYYIRVTIALSAICRIGRSFPCSRLLHVLPRVAK
jgi:hypothetical protein